MTYLYKGLTIERRGKSFWPIGDDYKERLHAFIILGKLAQEKFRQ